MRIRYLQIKLNVPIISANHRNHRWELEPGSETFYRDTEPGGNNYRKPEPLNLI